MQAEGETVAEKSFAYCYDIHGIIRIQSTRLPELGYFRVPALAGPADLTVQTTLHSPAANRSSPAKNPFATMTGSAN